MAKLLLVAVIIATAVICCQCDAAPHPQHTRVLQTLGVRLAIRGAGHYKQQQAQQLLQRSLHRKLLGSAYGGNAATEEASYLPQTEPHNTTNPNSQPLANATPQPTAPQANQAESGGCWMNCP